MDISFPGSAMVAGSPPSNENQVDEEYKSITSRHSEEQAGARENKAILQYDIHKVDVLSLAGSSENTAVRLKYSREEIDTAILNSDCKMIKTCLEQGVNVQELWDEHQSVLIKVIRGQNRFDLLMVLLEAGLNPDAELQFQTGSGVAWLKPLFTVALAVERFDVGDLLIAKGFDLESANVDVVAQSCAIYNECKLLKYLLQKGLDPDRKCNEQPLIFWALRHRRSEAAMLLLHYGANPNVADYTGLRPAISDFMRPECSELFRSMLLHGAETEYQFNGEKRSVVKNLLPGRLNDELYSSHRAFLQALLPPDQRALYDEVKDGNTLCRALESVIKRIKERKIVSLFKCSLNKIALSILKSPLIKNKPDYHRAVNQLSIPIPLKKPLLNHQFYQAYSRSAAFSG
ncbi:ankyrin repeat domain-containing protein [Endozoicomonas ascidiicola]|uniref:ankyrin repeat domain-containing protein n=1 Tax=Endozoicomonas ascidiicola TaxID=1698521 RepID=UPI00082D23D6|nr:ankyrin repeat domain-containing protein [Endozoicomonas ascidiicola]